MRSAMLALVQPAMIRAKLLSKIDTFIRSHLHGWAGSRVDIQEKTKEVLILSLAMAVDVFFMLNKKILHLR
jgi:brassinosteroid-6-oxidase 1